jgi:hypothetical protein
MSPTSMRSHTEDSVPPVANKYNWDLVSCSIRNDSRGSNLITAVIHNSVPVGNWETINPENYSLCGCAFYPFYGPPGGSCSTCRFIILKPTRRQEKEVKKR